METNRSAKPEPFWLFVGPLNAAGLRYLVTGATAAILYGAPRLTNDLDLVLDLPRTSVPSLPNVFPASAFYLPPLEVLEVERARAARGHFNIIHLNTGYKADVYLAGQDSLHKWAFDHRKSIDLEGGSAWIAPPEYVIIRKLEFYVEGRSEKHPQDIRSILQTSGAGLNRDFLDQQIASRGLSQTWASLSAEA